MEKTKRIRVIVLAFFCLPIFMGWGIQPTEAAAFPTDIADHWASAPISALVSSGVVSGYADGTFQPDKYVSRAEFITMINKAFNFNASADVRYYDVKAGDWYYNEIAKAAAAKYIAGYPDGSMKPENPISREEAAVILAGVLNLDTASPDSLLFADVAGIHVWSKNAVAALVQAGYISGYPDGTFAASNSISRAEAAVMIYKASFQRAAVTGVSLDRSSLKLGVEKTHKLVATVYPSNATNPTLVWSSSNPAVATVSNDGVVLAEEYGTAIITVTTQDRNQTATCYVVVSNDVWVSGVSLDETSISLEVDDTVFLEANVYPSAATNQNLLWRSSDPAIAAVSSSGEVTAREKGSCTITVETEDGGYTDTCRVTVKDMIVVVGVSLNANEITLQLGGTFKLLPAIEPVAAAKRGVIWESSDEDVATVSSYGTVRAESKGTCYITVITKEGGYAASCKVTVIE